MKTLIMYSLIAFAMINSAFAQTNSPDRITGTWLIQDGSAKVKIEKSNGKFVGKIVWLNPPQDKNGKPWMDVKNPDKSLQSRTILGLLLLTDFVFDEGNTWNNGNIYDTDSGKNYSCKITMKDNNVIEVRGYVGISLFGRTETWKRSQDITMN